MTSLVSPIAVVHPKALAVNNGRGLTGLYSRRVRLAGGG